ncbi:hypothetical protein [Streptomyces sp. NPDC004680]|uniref:hypothetical protein n=1 Tax=Streptomyces sp. NPDC004680 TaxID=3154287 RepID=UPI0033B50AAA
MPALLVERLEAAHPGDDDHVYGRPVGHGSCPARYPPGGRPPFFLEADGRVRTSDVTEAVVAWLRSGDTPDHRAATVDA